MQLTCWVWPKRFALFSWQDTACRSLGHYEEVRAQQMCKETYACPAATGSNWSSSICKAQSPAARKGKLLLASEMDKKPAGFGQVGFTPRTFLRKMEKLEIPGLCSTLRIKRDDPVCIIWRFSLLVSSCRSAWIYLPSNKKDWLFYTNSTKPQHFSRNTKSRWWNWTAREGAVRSRSLLEAGVSQNSQAKPCSC